ncbi:hydroxyneurosporene dehydrogenase [Streptosporangium sp. 'caverna']|uniref:hydroxyneurosporene dehydrogenase n=1 Tax=Streptosporangium sp. 'caverna' TaxID=2202249 RepID=UPI000D7D446E|nr:hydroxyneurosporene dehydrogenase [Streptosporangium sp. 'caverna']AWS42526.1 hydroxyneurosporene dehydrogenase [Streptosporangium sp. 'caverna']
MTQQAGIARTDADYRRIGIRPDVVAEWEDGARTDGRRGTYEWWYFDAHLDDGATLVVIFMTKDLSTPGKPLSPVIRLNLDLPDGRRYNVIQDFPAASFSARTDRADVRIAGNVFSGDLAHYEIRADVGGVRVDVALDAEIRPWRPHTGHLLFGEKRDLEFSWLPAVPQGTVRGSYEVAGVRTEVGGVGYHDHNWGNVGMMSIIHDWYWARGQAGPYSVIASYITAHKKYGYEPIPIFMLARDGRVVADDASRVRFEALDTYLDGKTGKPVARTTRYHYDDGDDGYVVTFTKHRDLVANTFVEQMKGWRKAAARLIRVDGAYLRFTGDLTIEHRKHGETVETFTEEAIWELMYFGHARTETPRRPGPAN